MPAKHLSVGKVTYIHGATPKRTTMTSEMLDAAEQDMAQHRYEPPPQGVRIQSMSDYKPDEPSVEVYYGGPASGAMGNAAPFPELDEFDVWGTSPNPSNPRRFPIDWHLIAVSICILLTLAMLCIGLVALAQVIRLSGALTPQTPSTTQSTK
jgi:hypothetical protein